MSSIVTAWLTPRLIFLMTSLFGTKRKRELVKNCGSLTQLLSSFSEHSTRSSVSWIILSCDVVPLVKAGILQNFANAVCNKDWLLFIRVNPLENGRAV